MKNWPVGRKLGVGFGVAVLLMLGMAALAVYELSMVHRLSDQVIQDRYPKVALVEDAKQNIGEIVEHVTAAVLTADKQEAEARIANVEKLRQHNDGIFKQLEQTLVAADARAQLDQATAQRGELGKMYPTLYALIRADQRPEALAYFGSTWQPRSDALSTRLAELGGVVEDQMTAAGQESATLYAQARWQLGIGALVLLVLTSSCAIWLTQLIRSPLLRAKEIATRIADGDLTASWDGVPVHGDEIGQTLGAMRDMQANLTQLLRDVSDKATRVSGSAEILATASLQVAQSSQAQSESASASAAAVEQLTVSVDQLTANATEASDKAVQAGQHASSGEQVVNDASRASREIETKVDEASEEIRVLSENVRQIGAITVMIREVADQTNLLALNAAIEAARAGEQGRGFAVVADEVRKLAERTTVSAHEISSMVDTIQQGATRVVDAMQRNREVVGQVVTAAETATEAMTHIRSSADGVRNAVIDIRGTLQEQRGASTQVAREIEAIAQMADENSAAADSVSSTVQGLKNVAQELSQTVGKFRLA
ncbi:methyl-accepting chemotaxis protein [Uliginosibacterium sp. H1]|uniref:methyl-accepting chemotaxis protein n=1 Tax=Uliginosibacterium sp. H1 TaxID=3114757 RepID=UPI002E193075|nr:methyl-accepting chemotaxis protein [Uliginosibacterium sp. H1]